MPRLSIALLIALLEVPLLLAPSGASGDQPSPVHAADSRLVHREAPPLGGPWPDSRSAAKSLAVCPSTDVPSLQADALLDYLRSTSYECVYQSLTSSDPEYRKAWPVVFSDANMQSVFAEIERVAPSYAGTDGSEMLNLWLFVSTGYGPYRWFPYTGVGPFNVATVQAFLDASDAFGASEHLLEASEVFLEYFETAFAADLREKHLNPIKRVFSEFNPDLPHHVTILDRVVYRTYGAFHWYSDRMSGFISAASQDPEFLEALLRVSRQDSFFLFEEDSDPFRWRLGLLEAVVKIVVKLSHIGASQEAATAALVEVIQWHERLSGPYLIAADRLEDLVDCSSYNICREDLEPEAYARALPNTYQLNEDLVVHTVLDRSAVSRFAQGAREIKARFHRLTESDEDVRTHLDTFRVRAYQAVEKVG